MPGEIILLGRASDCFGAGPAASYRGRSGAFSDELQPTESFRNVSDPQYEFGTLGGDDMGKAFA